MGQAKSRGTYEDRVAQAMQRRMEAARARMAADKRVQVNLQAFGAELLRAYGQQTVLHHSPIKSDPVPAAPAVLIAGGA